jgi:GT2 family glycosyltransferase
MTSTKYGLVTVLFNSDDVLEDFFKSLIIQVDANTYFELYLIDNTYSEKSTVLINNYIAKVANTFKVYHINAGGNIGVAAGNNLGIHHALKNNCTHVVLLNNDISIDDNTFFIRLINTVEKNHYKLLVPKILYPNNNLIWMAGGYMNEWRALGIHEGMGLADKGQFNKIKRITYAPTCFMVIDKVVFETIGFMDEKYFAYYDDTDFVLRANRKKIDMYYDPTFTVIHKVSSSSGGDSSMFYIYYSNRNKIYFIYKNLKGAKFFAAIVTTFLTRMLYYVKFDKARRLKLRQAIKDGFLLKRN